MPVTSSLLCQCDTHSPRFIALPLVPFVPYAKDQMRSFRRQLNVLVAMTAGLASAQTTETRSFSYTRTLHEEAVRCWDIVRHRTRVVARMANGPVISEATVEKTFLDPEVQAAVVQARAALVASTVDPITISHAAVTMHTAVVGEKVEARHGQKRTVGITRRETRGPATLAIGVFGDEAHPCAGYGGGQPIGASEDRSFDFAFTKPVTPVDCPLAGTPFVVAAGSVNIDTLTHVHTDIYSPTTTTRTTLTTYTYELIGIPESKKIELDTAGSSFLVAQISVPEKSDTLVEAVNSGTTAVCVNLYAFTKDSQLAGCCSCPIASHGSHMFSAKFDTHGSQPERLAFTLKLHAASSADGKCSSTAGKPGNSVGGLHTWATTIEYEDGRSFKNLTSFSRESAEPAELDRLTARCTELQRGRLHGLCRSCTPFAVDSFGPHPYCQL